MNRNGAVTYWTNNVGLSPSSFSIEHIKRWVYKYGKTIGLRSCGLIRFYSALLLFQLLLLYCRYKVSTAAVWLFHLVEE